MPFKLPDWASQPNQSIDGYLEVVQQQQNKSQFPLNTKSHYLIGRLETNDIVDAQSSVSGEHAAIVHHNSGRFYLIDLQSRNNVYVNGEKIEPNKPCHVFHKDVFTIGRSDTTYMIHFPSDQRPSSNQTHTPANAASGPAEVRASHILVKHKDSRRPSSHKEAVITRTREEAEAIIQGFLDELPQLTGSALQARFGQIAQAESHCSSARSQGDLGTFGRGKMQAPFEEASFALGVGEMSGIVNTASGTHIILRTA